jgi:hypothetical protein
MRFLSPIFFYDPNQIPQPNMPKIAGSEALKLWTSEKIKIAELRLRSFRSCGIAIAEVLPSSCRFEDSKKGCACPHLVNKNLRFKENFEKMNLKFFKQHFSVFSLSFGTSDVKSLL